MDPPSRPAADARRYALTAIDRAMAVLEALEHAAPRSLSEVARSASLTQATALRYLSSLMLHGLVERQADGRYRLGLRLFQLGQRVLDGRDPRTLALPLMNQLRAQFGETVNLGARVQDELVLIDALEGTWPLKLGARVGGVDPWHASGLGKAILAFLTDPDAEALLAKRGCPALTPHTLSAQELRADLERTRQRGYAVDREEAELGLACAAAPIFGPGGTPTHAISVSGPSIRMTPERIEQIARALIEVAASISKRLGAVPAQ